MKITRKNILMILLAGSLGFIWINSMLTANVSGGMSGQLGRIIASIFGDTFITDGILRKFAHAFEFSVLGTILSLLLYDVLKDKLTLVALCGISAAFIDETIQIFTPGRSAEIRDMWIDLLGFSCAVGIVFYIKYRKK